MTSTEVKKRSCHLIVQIGDINPCYYGKVYSNLTENNARKYLPNYFFNLTVCCKNSTEVANYIEEIGINVN
jgi:hypothetical protein